MMFTTRLNPLETNSKRCKLTGERCPPDTLHLGELRPSNPPALSRLHPQSSALRTHTPSVASLLDYNVSSFNIHGNIIKEDSNTITLGASGDTITLASGASQTGFGRTGTVDWDTTPKLHRSQQYLVMVIFVIQHQVLLQLTYQREVLEQ